VSIVLHYIRINWLKLKTARLSLPS